MRSRYIALLMSAALLAGCALLSEPPPMVTVDAGITPRMSPGDVAARVTAVVEDMESVAGGVKTPLQIISMTATSPAGLARLDPVLTLERLPADEVVWLVRAKGTFATDRGRTNEIPRVWDSGYVVVADSDASVRAVGFP
jgi:hypothetical protein